jgi:DNA-binding LacI/PurR family transcriptional regulator
MGNRITLKEVAALAGVSYQTVSKLLNNRIQVSPSTEKRIWKAIEDLGYRPNLVARSLRSQRSHMIGYSWEPTSSDQVNSILDQFLQSMLQETERAGYHLLSFPFKPGCEGIDGYRELLTTHHVDGFILSSIEYDDPRILFLLEQGYPFVAFGRSNPGLEFPYVDVDGAAGMRMVIEHLLSLGHRRIAILAWPESSRVGQNRMDGIDQALTAAGIEIPPGFLARGEGNYQFGYQATCVWLDLQAAARPTAIVAFNDVMAIGAMNAVRSCGMQPGVDIALIGFDDAPLVQYLAPSLTTVRQPIWEVGQRVVSMLSEIMVGNQPTNTHQLVVPCLIVRESSGMKI